MTLKTQSITELLKLAQYRATPQRIAVLSLLRDETRPRTADELHAMLGKKSPNRATIYRILEAFVVSGLARRIDFQENAARYEFGKRADHHHIVCTSCATIEDIRGCNVTATTQHALSTSKKFSRITGHSFELFGLCNTCS